MGHRAENNFDLNLLQIGITQLHDLLKAFLPQSSLGLFEELVLTFDHGAPDFPLTVLVALGALLKRQIEEKKHAGYFVLAGQFQQILACLGGQGGGIHHAQPVQVEALFNQEVDQLEGRSLKPLIPLVVTNARPRPVRGNDLGGPEVAFSKGRFSASCGPAQHDNRGPQQPNGFLRGFTSLGNGFSGHKAV